MALESFERETCMGWNNSIHICQLITFNKTLIRKLDTYCKDYPKEYKKVNDIYIDGVLEAKEYEFPKKFVTIRKPNTRKMTEQQKQAAAERMKKINRKNTSK
jgi:hypothetical protein